MTISVRPPFFTIQVKTRLKAYMFDLNLPGDYTVGYKKVWDQSS